jgi:hypothetical protein
MASKVVAVMVVRTRNIHLDNLKTGARVSLDFCRIVGA